MTIVNKALHIRVWCYCIKKDLEPIAASLTRAFTHSLIFTWKNEVMSGFLEIVFGNSGYLTAIELTLAYHFLLPWAKEKQQPNTNYNKTKTGFWRFDAIKQAHSHLLPWAKEEEKRDVHFWQELLLTAAFWHERMWWYHDSLNFQNVAVASQGT